MTSDPLLSANPEPHRLQLALAIRAAIEDGLSAPALDMVRIGMGGGASGGDRSYIPTTQANVENRVCHGRWVLACRAAEPEHHIVELFATGTSLRQIAAHGPDVVTGIATFIGECFDGTVQERKDDYARRHPPRSIKVEAAIVVQSDQDQLSLRTAREQERKVRRAARVFLDGDRHRLIQRRAPPWTPKV